MMKQKAIASLTAVSLLFGGAVTAHAAETDTQTQPTVQTTQTAVSAYYNYDGYASADLVKDAAVKAALDANGFKYDGVKLGDSLKQVKKVMKTKGYDFKATIDKHIYTVHGSEIIFVNGKVDTININFNRGKTTVAQVQKAFGKQAGKLIGQSPAGSTAAFMYNVVDQDAKVTVNFVKAPGSKYYATSLVVSQ